MFNTCEYGIFSNLYTFDPYQLFHTVSDLLARGADVDDFLYYYTPFDDEEHMYNVYNELQAREAGYETYSQAQQAGEEAADQVGETEILRIRYFSPRSPLGQALQHWYNCKPLELANHVRSGYYDQQSELIFYVTGVGYDTVSRDLLGKAADGKACQQFEQQYQLTF